MAHFETDAEVYDQLGGILTNLVGNTGRLEQLRQADAVVQFAFRGPDAKVTLDVRAGKEPRVELGDSRLRPDVVFAMDAEVGRALLHGEVAAMVALARGEVRLKGHVGKALRVVPATVGAHEVEADQPVEAVVAGAEPPAVEEAEAVAETPAAEGEASPVDAEAPTEGAAPEGEASPVEAEAPSADEALATAEAADAAGGEEPPAASDEQE